MKTILTTDKELKENIGKRVSYEYEEEIREATLEVDTEGDIKVDGIYLSTGNRIPDTMSNHDFYEYNNNGVTNITLLDEPDSKPTEELYELDPSKCRKVLVRDYESDNWQERILVTSTSDGKAMCVDSMHTERFLARESFSTVTWKYYKEIPTEPKEEFIPFDTVEELFSLKDKWFRTKRMPNIITRATTIDTDDMEVIFLSENETLKELLEHYEMLDEENNTWIPVGKLQQ